MTVRGQTPRTTKAATLATMARCVALRATGMTYKAIGAAVALNRSYVVDLLVRARKLGMAPEPSARPAKPAPAPKIPAARPVVARPAVVRPPVELPVSRFAHGGNPARDVEMLRLADAGLGPSALAAHFGMNSGHVCRRLETLLERRAEAENAAERAARRPVRPVVARPCLMCGGSERERKPEPGDRVCGHCKKSDTWRQGGGYDPALAGASWKR